MGVSTETVNEHLSMMQARLLESFKLETAIGKEVAIVRAGTSEMRTGEIVGFDESKGVVVRGTGRRGGEFFANAELLLTGFATNRRGHLRFALVPTPPEINERLFR